MTKNPGLLVAGAILGVLGVGALLLAGIQGPKANPFLGAESVRRAEAAAAAAAQPWIIGGWVMIGLAIVAVLMYIAAAPRPKPSTS